MAKTETQTPITIYLPTEIVHELDEEVERRKGGLTPTTRSDLIRRWISSGRFQCALADKSEELAAARKKR